MNHPEQLKQDSNAPWVFEEKIVLLLLKIKAHALFLVKSVDWAGDFLQKTCQWALSRKHQLIKDTQLGRWLAVIMGNIWTSELLSRAQRKKQDRIDPDRLANAAFETEVEAQIMVSDIRRAWGSLSSEEVTSLIQIYCCGRTYREMPDELCVPQGQLYHVSPGRTKGY